MNIKIKGTNFALTPAITDYIQKRLAATEKFLEGDSAAICDVEVGKTSGHHQHGDVFRAEVHIVGSHRNLYASAERSDLYAAIDEVRDEVIHRLSTDKGRKLSRMRRGGARIKNMIKGLWKPKNATDGNDSTE